MDIGEKLDVKSREEWRAWLSEHHQDKQDIWLILYKSTSGKQNLTLGDAQEESLCFGWIDSAMRPIDDLCYVLRFTPRRKQSSWSPTNRGRVMKLLREGKMTPAGMAQLPPDILQAWEEENNSK